MSYKDNYIPNNVVFNHGILPGTQAMLSTFDLSHSLTTTLPFDYVVPVLVDELNPNDHLEVTVKSLARLMPLVTPIMSNIKLDYFAFFVPNRLLWDKWQQFYGARVFQNDPNVHTLPVCRVDGVSSSSPVHVEDMLFDYLGVPPLPNGKMCNIVAFAPRAYNLIWNKWFRSNQLQSEVIEFVDSNSNFSSQFKLLKKGKPLDYFTSCLPYPQVADPVTIPLSSDKASVFTKANVQTVLNGYQNDSVSTSKVSAFSPHFPFRSGNVVAENILSGDIDQNTQLYVDLSKVSGITIETLRRASAMQVLLERDARSGETYIDIMNIHYGVQVPDFLVGRPQYLGKATSYINVEPIAQTGESSGTPLGHLSAVGFGSESEKLCEISTVEHGIFMVLACVTGEIAYQQGLHRMFNKRTRYDYMFPEFWNIGDQAVLNKEIYLSGDPLTDEGVFGYAERYSEYRSGMNRISGKMRSFYQDTLDVWHLYENFMNLPMLSDEFIRCNTPISRALAVNSDAQILLNCWFDIKATRNIPVVSNPSLKVGGV